MGGARMFGWWLAATLSMTLVGGCLGGGTVDLDDDDSAGDDDDGPPGPCPGGVADPLASLADWEERVACADIEFGIAPDDTQTLAVTLSLALSGIEYQQGQTFETALIGDALTLQTGEYLLHYDCNDAIEFTEIVDREWQAVGGSAHVLVVDTGNGHAEVELTLDSVVVEEQDASPGTRCELPDATFDEVWVGWYPG
jgi:hypothetical protein